MADQVGRDEDAKFRLIKDKVKHFCRYGPADDMESGQSQFAPLRTRADDLTFRCFLHLMNVNHLGALQ